ncbi:hypothetical protein CHS0354_004623 [Potamilus streckersoni]|uniref:Phospholipase A2-like central domain-containing protein n=1 Tax=Potamilus streckersoni TaxID=2493646 RepID=A0AAE0S4Q7_9BIVA|nr:hypothetical protein CHS0354_004623 [Potamilus streckersoni]
MAEANYSLVTVSEEFIDPLVINCMEFNYQERNGTKRRNKNKVIFPGTKWCGIGSKAKNDGDLGDYNETDKCCRAHDKCDIYIDAFGNNYNLFNLALYTVLSCDCNAKFRDCLVTAANSSTTTDNDKWAANTSTPIGWFGLQSTPIGCFGLQTTPIGCFGLQSTPIGCFGSQSTPIGCFCHILVRVG